MINILLSFVLFLLSLSAYLGTKIRKLIFAVGAFGLFSIHSIIDLLEDRKQSFDAPFMDIILSSIILVILVLFFLAIIKRRQEASWLLTFLEMKYCKHKRQA